MTHTSTPSLPRAAVTLLELLVVVLIISILATIATGVYTGEAERARIAATQDLIHQLEVAITRYEADLGQFPPSGSGDVDGSLINLRDGSGFLQLALVHSMAGSVYNAPPQWRGPYINVKSINLDPTATVAGEFDILDAWGSPLVYVTSDFYESRGPSFTGGTVMFSSTRPDGANPDLPAPNPFVERGETYYNSSTYQIYSPGPNGKTFGVTSEGQFAGTEADDINNFGY
ncbi:MAG: hypothetical protein BWZ08_00874 [candidate division BRC1 bacterium ADurb.BinA292]|nr:MAG: hypothetical protein BWZ08_00874 [candidate division BRC1 bacterium ADurb.BinA292]